MPTLSPNILALLPEYILTLFAVLIMLAEPCLKPAASRKPLGWLAIAATLLAGVFVADQTHVRHQRQQAELAQQQFDAAMRITDQTLDHVRQQLQQAGVPVGN